MNGIRIRGGRIIDPVRGRDGVGELLVWDGRIVPALPEGAGVSAERRKAERNFTVLHCNLTVPL